MLSAVITYMGKRKNPAFQLDPLLKEGTLRRFAWNQARAWIRGKFLILRGFSSRLLFLGRGVQLRNLNNLQLGRMVRIHDQVTIDALGRGKMKIGDQVSIGRFSHLFTSFGLNDLGKGITIGNNVGIGDMAHLGGAGGLEIGDDCIIGPYFSCHPENHNFDRLDQPIRLQGVSRKGIQIGSNCWIGAKVTVLDGVTIGNNCVIAAGAVVTRSFPENSVIGGVPAKILKTRS
jgi:acetyltransferase-like isoleucine patch superfamily enzyme